MLKVKSCFWLNQIRNLGAIRSAGRAFAKRGESQEEEYFYKQRQEQLAILKAKIADKSGKKIEDVKKELKK